MKFSKSTQCFYPSDIQYASLPSDVIECTQDDFNLAMSRPPGTILDVQDGRVIIIPEPPPAPSVVKSRKWDTIKAERDRRKSQGGVKVGTKWFHSDDASRIQQIGLVMMGASIPSNLEWKTMDGSFVTMTQTLAGQIFQASAANDMTIFAAAEAHRVAMEASADPASYDFSTGWPKAFGE